MELARAEQVDSQGIIGTARLRFAEVYSYQGSTESAREYAREAYEVGSKNNWKILCEEAMALMS